MDATIPDHVIYRPKDLRNAVSRKLPIIVWGNGGCAGDGAGQRLHLLSLASQGYLVIANGVIGSGPGSARFRRDRYRLEDLTANSYRRRRRPMQLN